MNTRGKTEKRSIIIHYLDEAKKKPDTYLKYRCWEAYGKMVTPYKRANASTWQILEIGDDITVKRSDGSEAKFSKSECFAECYWNDLRAHLLFCVFNLQDVLW